MKKRVNAFENSNTNKYVKCINKYVKQTTEKIKYFVWLLNKQNNEKLKRKIMSEIKIKKGKKKKTFSRKLI